MKWLFYPVNKKKKKVKVIKRTIVSELNKMLFLKFRNLAPGFWLLCSLLSSVTLGLRYDYGDGTYYVGSVDNDGKPNGRGQFYNSSGSLGKLMLLLFCDGTINIR